MADMTLCTSQKCPVRTRCRRNEACPDAYKADERRQSYAIWHPTAGASCPGFIDAAATTEDRNP